MKFLHRLLSDVPLMDAAALAAYCSMPLDVHAAEHPIFKQIKERLKPEAEYRKDGVAVIPVEGPLAYKPDVYEMIFGVEDSRNVLAMINDAKESEKVDGILLNIDSPGGMMLGGLEIADAVKAADKIKPVVAWSGGWATSLAYLIGSQASAFVASRTAQIGSIGTVITLADYTKLLEARGIKVEVFTNKEGTLKATGAIGTSLTEEQKEYIQSRVDKAHAEFKKAVLSQRPDIGAEHMKGQVFFASEAKKIGMIERLGDMNFAISALHSEIRKRRPRY